MATLVLTAIGTALGGPLGGAIGALAGRALDSAIIGSPKHEGPRLKDLSVTTSSYGAHIPRHFGRVRSAGTIIWATDLVEHSKKSGGGKGKPSVTTYTYSISCAIALASRPVRRIGRIWADGDLLRGERGDLKVGGKMRFYAGHADQAPDPLMAAAIGPSCPAFRGLSYVVFENLQLADFGNRLPSLTFEIVADDNSIGLTELVPDRRVAHCAAQFDEITGFTHDGGSDADVMQAMRDFYPFAFDAGGGRLAIRLPSAVAGDPVVDLPPAVASRNGEFARRTGTRRSRTTTERADGVGLRYYDLERDYQPGLQRSRGRSGSGWIETIEFPACLHADHARTLAEKAAAQREQARETMAYRIATINPNLACGSLVRPSGERGVWRIQGWEWRAEGVELELEAVDVVASAGLIAGGDPGVVNAAPDRANGETILQAFELPWDGTGSGAERKLYAAASSTASGWQGAELYVDRGDGALLPAGTTTRSRAIVGLAMTALPAATPHLIDRRSEVIVQLADDGFGLDQTDMAGLARGENRALIGGEIIQFAHAVTIGGGEWRLSGLLRGRGGTEDAVSSHLAGEDFALLDERLSLLDAATRDGVSSPTVYALGNGDAEPVPATVRNLGMFDRPLAPVALRMTEAEPGGIRLSWTRRARGAWQWLDEVDVPLPEIAENYDIRIVDGAAQTTGWMTNTSVLEFTAGEWGAITARPEPRHIEIRQIGTRSTSYPLVSRI